MKKKVNLIDMITGYPTFHREADEANRDDIVLFGDEGVVGIGPDTDYADEDARQFGEMLLRLRDTVAKSAPKIDQEALIKRRNSSAK